MKAILLTVNSCGNTKLPTVFEMTFAIPLEEIPIELLREKLDAGSLRRDIMIAARNAIDTSLAKLDGESHTGLEPSLGGRRKRHSKAERQNKPKKKRASENAR